MLNFALANIHAAAESARSELKHHAAEVDGLSKEVERLEDMRASLVASETQGHGVMERREGIGRMHFVER